MTRRGVLFALAWALPAPGLVRVPVRRIVDGRAGCTPEQLLRFWWSIWPEAVRDLGRCGIRIEAQDAAGEIRRSPGSRPVFVGLERGFINLVATREIPLGWARGRGIAGVTTIWEGYHVCVIALEHAHAHRIPFVAVNTCVHELLHGLLGDIFAPKPSGFAGMQRELFVDALATRLWLFGEGAGIRSAARKYLERLSAKEAYLRATRTREG